MTPVETLRAVVIGGLVAVPVACILALLWVSLQRREPIPWVAMWRALTRRERGRP